jgi:hypothetical protein
MRAIQTSVIVWQKPPCAETANGCGLSTTDMLTPCQELATMPESSGGGRKAETKTKESKRSVSPVSMWSVSRPT